MAKIEWPDDGTQQPPRPDWRDTLTIAADLALLGIVVTLAALPVVTAGAALGAGSVATGHWVRHRGFPPVRELARWYLRWLLPGAAATALAALAGLLLASDLRALAVGAVPGGTGVLAVTVIVVALAATVAMLTLVHLGRQPDAGWLAAARLAVSAVVAAPHRAAALPLVAALAGLLGFMVPVTTPLALGYALFAMHVVAARLLPEPGPEGGPDSGSPASDPDSGSP